MIHPKEALLNGVEILQRVLAAYGFRFHFRGEGDGSGGKYAWGEFVRDDRKLELHFRYALGLVRYQVGALKSSHETYMRELGVWDQCQYPGFSEDPLAAFDHLAHDLNFAEDFLFGAAEVLQKAALRETAQAVSSTEDLMAMYVGDTQRIEQMRDRLRENRYSDVLKIASELQFPDRLSPSHQRMIQIARSKMNKHMK